MKKCVFVLIDSILTQHQPEEADQGITSPVVFFLIFLCDNSSAPPFSPPPLFPSLSPSLAEWTHILLFLHRLLLLGYTPLPSAAAPEPCAM